MGGFVKDGTTGDVFHLWNSRLRNDGSLQEMVVIQKEFAVFSEKYSLKQALRILHIVPDDIAERRGWFTFLDYLKRYPSDQDGVTGHDRIVRALQENLEGDAPSPVYIATHRAADNDRVTVTGSQRPIVYEDQQYLVISIPTTPAAPPRSA
jgi:hypothetical protein